MSRYLKPKLKITRRLGELPSFTQKVSNRTKTPGQHGTDIKIKSKSSSSSNYGRRLMEKQKLRFNYGVSESGLLSYVTKAKKKRGSAGVLLLQMLELRLDNIVYQLGFTPSIQASRQMVNHGHILVNNQKINIPSFECNIGDRITLDPRSKFYEKFEHIQIPKKKHLELIESTSGKSENKHYLGIIKQMPDRKEINLVINELLVIEYYSK